MNTVALCATPAALLVAFAATVIHTFRARPEDNK